MTNAKKEATEKEATEKEATEKAFTEMTNISKKPLYLEYGTVQPGETVPFNNAEYSTLHMFLEAK